MGLDIVELVLAVEERFQLEIPDEEAQCLETPRQLVDYVAQRRQATSREYAQIEEIVFEVVRETTGPATFDPDAHFVRDLNLE